MQGTVAGHTVATAESAWHPPRAAVSRLVPRGRPTSYHRPFSSTNALIARCEPPSRATSPNLADSRRSCTVEGAEGPDRRSVRPRLAALTAPPLGRSQRGAFDKGFNINVKGLLFNRAEGALAAFTQVGRSSRKTRVAAVNGWTRGRVLRDSKAAVGRSAGADHRRVHRQGSAVNVISPGRRNAYLHKAGLTR